jgi:hypothetical protein
MPDVSKRSCLTRPILRQCRFRNDVQLPGIGVRLQLAIPRLGVERREPLPENGELLGRQLGDLAFEHFDLGHVSDGGPSALSLACRPLEIWMFADGHLHVGNGCISPFLQIVFQE